MFHYKSGPLRLLSSVVALSLLSQCHRVSAATPPTAGQAEQNAQKIFSPPPTSLTEPGVTITEQTNLSPIKQCGPKLLVDGFRIVGQTGVKEVDVDRVTKLGVGKELTLGEIKGVADSITRLLRSRGYIVARAYIPAQKIAGGIITVNVIIGRYGAIEIHNNSTLNSGFLRTVLGLLRIGDTIRQSTLERVLLLLTDIGGIRVSI